MGTAWARHAMCESAFMVFPPAGSNSYYSRIFPDFLYVSEQEWKSFLFFKILTCVF
jgi:hypothetical protein